MKQRLQKIIATAGIASRRAAERLILEGRVQVDGKVVSQLGESADPDTADIRVDGVRVKVRARRRYVALHKPQGYVTTRSDPSRRRTVMDLLPRNYQSLYPVGRLDIATSGLLVLTDDGELAQLLAHPRHGVRKTYLVTVSGTPDRRALERARRGIQIQGERLHVDRAQPLSRRGTEARTSRLRVTLREGRNREIRRLFGALGFPVVAIHRERIGELSLRGIPPGGFRPLSRDEVERLRREATH
ncbi:MAG TPA: pseudouridine synthase [Vicinamibacteria bacterium]|nr:pseudouridine synthase [Vicinamibacteria bacterium]